MQSPASLVTTWLITAMVLIACVGTMEEKDPTASGNAGVDAGTSASTCDDPAPSALSGEHNPGTDCLACHSQMGSGPEFTIGGTLYDGVNSNTAVVGGTIRVTDSDGLELKLISAQNGNFWTREALAFPVTVTASECPDTLPMISPVSQAGGSCSMGGCHTDTFRVYLP
jgi:hypothetical protein